VSLVERSCTVSIEVDDAIDLSTLEAAAVAFARNAPGQLIGCVIERLTEDLLTHVVGPARQPRAARDQGEAPWACSGCGSRCGFRRRGFRSRPRTVTAACGRIAFRVAQVECLSCGRRFAPALGLLGLRAHQRRTERVTELAAGLACEVAYAKASSLLAELAGVAVSARSIRRDVMVLAPERLGPELSEVPVLLLDSTGERAGAKRNGVDLNLAIGLVARRRLGGRVAVSARLLGATLDEHWSAMAELLAGLRPGLILTDGEEELAGAVARLFPGVPTQRCLFHLARGLRYAIWRDGGMKGFQDRFVTELAQLLNDAYATADLATARAAYRDLIDALDQAGAPKAAGYLLIAEPEVFTFLTHPQAGRLLFGHKGRAEIATSVLERVMRELNRRTDNGTRWSIEGLRALLMVKLGRKYAHGRWAPRPEPLDDPKVRLRLVA